MNINTIRKQTSFRLNSNLLRDLREEAERHNRSLNNFVESILMSFMAHNAKTDGHKESSQKDLAEESDTIKSKAKLEKILDTLTHSTKNSKVKRIKSQEMSKEEWINQMREISNSFKSDLVDLDDEKTRYILKI